MPWIVVKTKKNNEDKAAKNLFNQGFKTFFPKCRFHKKIFNRSKLLLRPLFPGYVFVYINDNQPWNKINNTFGVSYVLTNGGKLSFLPDNIYFAIKRKCDQFDVLFYQNKMKKGDKIRFKEEKMMSFEAIFYEYIDTNRVIILMNLLNNKIKTVTNVNKIENFI